MHAGDVPEFMVDVAYTRLESDAGQLPDVTHCLNYYDRLRGSAFAPSWQDFDWTEIPSDLIPHFGVVDVTTDPLDFTYRFWGSAHAVTHDQELTGKSVREMLPTKEAESVFKQYCETYKARAPLLFANTIHAGRFRVAYRETSLRMPFSDDGVTVTHIVAFSDLRDDLDRLKQAFAEYQQSQDTVL